MAVVYRHRRLDTNEVFYVGIGLKEYRAYNKHNRKKHWHNIVDKCGYIVEIVAKDLDYEDAKELEMLLIETYGRRLNNTGPLVNITEGGEGTKGMFFKHTPETIAKMSQSRIGHNVSKETRLKISANHGRSRIVINVATGEEFKSCAEAARKIGMNQDTLSEKLRGRRFNNTDLEYK